MPPSTFDTTESEGLVKARFPVKAFNHVHEAAGTRETDDNKREACRKFSTIPRRLIDQHESLPDLSVEVLERELHFPIALPPVGAQMIFHSHGETVTSKVAGDAASALH